MTASQKIKEPKPQSTLKNRTIFCRDNLEVLRGINSNSIDLIYLDPPFNKGKNFHAPIGSSAEGADFADIWTPDSVKDEWHNQINEKHPTLYKYLDAVGGIGSHSAKYYLIYMAVRLIEMHRILKDTGSIYLHCDPTASHYLKLLLDTIFDHQNFQNEVIWSYRTGGVSKRRFSRKHDIILFYSKTSKYSFNNLKEKAYTKSKSRRPGIVNYRVPVEFFEDACGVYHWVNKRDVWDVAFINTQAGERVGYPTQKPLALLEQILKASSNKNDIVLDPFCGCATTCVAAERLGRHWIGIDVSEKAFDLVRMRFEKELPDDIGSVGQPLLRKDIPQRTDLPHKSKPAKEDKVLLYGKQGGICAGCRTHLGAQHLAFDHIIPQSQGGSHELDNLQLLCSSCNSIKGAKPMEYLKERLKRVANL